MQSRFRIDGVNVEDVALDVAPVSSSGLPTLEAFPDGVDTPEPEHEPEERVQAYQDASYASHSPVHTVGSVADVQAYFMEAAQDASEYNTDYDDAGDDGSSRAGDIGIDEELARLT